MTTDTLIPLDLPMPILTPRLLLRAYQPGDGVTTAAAVAETWDELHDWMPWAERLEDNTPEMQELRTRQVMAKFLLREEVNLLGIELATGLPVVWCGFHDIQWQSRQCETGYWVRKSAQGRGYATEATNALLRYAFQALGMQRVGINHAAGNAASQRVIEKLGFGPEGIQRSATRLPGGRLADRLLYARLNTTGLPPLQVTWDRTAFNQPPSSPPSQTREDLSEHLRSLEEQLLSPAVRARPEAVAALLTEDFREFGSSGRSYTKGQILDHLSGETYRPVHLTNFHCDRLTADTALVTYRSHREDHPGTTSSALRSSVWVRRENGWQMHFHQGTKE